MKLAKKLAATPNEARIIRQTGPRDNGSMKFILISNITSLPLAIDRAALRGPPIHGLSVKQCIKCLQADDNRLAL